MDNISKIIQERRSVRTFDGRNLTAEDMESLCAFMQQTDNPYRIPVEFVLLSARERGLSCPVVSGTDLYVGGKIKRGPFAFEAFGYSFERLVLYAQSLGVGTVWLGGTMNRSAFEAAMELDADEIMPCASPLGYPSTKMSMRENMMRKAIKADERMPFEELFFDGAWEVPLSEERAGALSHPLNMVRLAPSAVNRQPWRAVVAGNIIHFYLKRSRSIGHGASLDMQKIDMGIALCHFSLAAEESGLNITFVQYDPSIAIDNDAEYIASYLLK